MTISIGVFEVLVLAGIWGGIVVVIVSLLHIANLLKRILDAIKRSEPGMLIRT